MDDDAEVDALELDEDGDRRLLQPDRITGLHYLPGTDQRETLVCLPVQHVHNFLNKCQKDGFSFSVQLRKLDTRRLRVRRWAQVSLRRNRRWFVPMGVTVTLDAGESYDEDNCSTVFIRFVFPLPDPEPSYFERAGMSQLLALQQTMDRDGKSGPSAESKGVFASPLHGTRWRNPHRKRAMMSQDR